MYLAISKGRILEESLKLLERLNIKCEESPMDSRKLIFRTNDKNMKIIIVRASDVPTYVESGKVDMGIVGKDTLLEKNSNDLLRLKDLEIAKCRLVIAGKKGVSLVSNMKIATKYPTITQKYFQSQGLPCTILKLYGSIELAAVLGMADAVVDLVETGNTLKENGLSELKIIEEISSYLVVNKTSYRFNKEYVDKFISKIS